MFKEQMNKIKALIPLKKESSEEDGNKKRKIENLVAFLIILVVTLIAINTILGKDKKSDSKDSEQSAFKILASDDNLDNYEYDELEKRLENIIETMAGVGKANVLITYSKSSEVIAMYNENNSVSHTQETDSEGGTRTSEEEQKSKEVIFTEENGANVPATQTIINPKVEGVIVTAEGASDANIKADIISAVVAVTGAQAHKVQVFSIN